MPTRSSPSCRSTVGVVRRGSSTSCSARARSVTGSASTRAEPRSTICSGNPHGRDFGPLVERLPDIIRTPSGKVELAPEPLIEDLARLESAIPGLEERGLVLVGRRHLRSNNSWMHNINVLVKGAPRCTLQVHPDDAISLGLADGSPASVTSRVGSVIAPVEVTDSIRPGVVSLPHGWGHDMPGTRMRIAAEHAGVNSNVLSDDAAMDPLSGTSVLNGIPVSVAPA